MKTLLFAAGVAAVLVTVASAGGSATAGGGNGLNIRNGVIYACYETRGDPSTRGDLKLFRTDKGCKPIAWSIKGPKGATGPAGPGANGPTGPAGAAGATGATGATGVTGSKGDKGDKGDTGDKGDKGDNGQPGKNPVDQWGGFSIAGRDDSGCITATAQEVWAHDSETRYFVVAPAQDGSGYFVTRYDLKGTYTTIPGMHDPGVAGCTGEAFTGAQSGPFNGVWTMKVSISGAQPVDYNPDAQPEGSSWDDFLNAVFGVDSSSSHVTTTSYEFDYYNSCSDHWRDSYYNGSFFSSGGIRNCPRD